MTSTWSGSKEWHVHALCMQILSPLHESLPSSSAFWQVWVSIWFSYIHLTIYRHSSYVSPHPQHHWYRYAYTAYYLTWSPHDQNIWSWALHGILRLLILYPLPHYSYYIGPILELYVWLRLCISSYNPLWISFLTKYIIKSHDIAYMCPGVDSILVI